MVITPRTASCIVHEIFFRRDLFSEFSSFNQEGGRASCGTQSTAGNLTDLRLCRLYKDNIFTLLWLLKLDLCNFSVNPNSWIVTVSLNCSTEHINKGKKPKTNRFPVMSYKRPFTYNNILVVHLATTTILVLFLFSSSLVEFATIQ